jgi:hypothetical protein
VLRPHGASARWRCRKGQSAAGSSRARRASAGGRKKIIAYDDVGSHFLQHMFQAIVLSGNVVDEQTIEDNTQQSQPWRSLFQLGVLRERIDHILIRTGRDWTKSGASDFDAVLKGASCEGNHFVTFVNEDARDGKHWIDGPGAGVVAITIFMRSSQRREPHWQL